MKILGITDGDDSGAVLLNDGKIVAAVNEERLSRMKMVIGFPHQSVEEVLRLGGVDRKDIDHVAMGALVERFNPALVANDGWFGTGKTGSKKYQIRLGSSLATVVGRFSPSQAAYHRLKSFMARDRQSGVRRIVAEELGISAPLEFYPHHICHGLSAYGGSGFDDAVVITLDGGGDGSCSHILRVSGGNIELLNNVDSYHSIGNFYSYVTHISGFKAGSHEGKITGLAAYGKPLYADAFRKLIAYKNGQIINKGNVYYYSAISKIQSMLPAGYKQEDLAASIQLVLEEVCIDYCRHWIQQSGMSKLAVAGGVFANVKLNQRIAEIEGVDELYVFPHMGDGGLAAGAAFAASLNLEAEERRHGFARMEDAYLGPDFSASEIETALQAEQLVYEQHPDIEAKVARLLAEGYVVARFNGRMEFGPRALGNRSILYQPTDPSVNEWLNHKLVRNEFMPFAPVSNSKDAGRCYKNIKGCERSARFMTITFDCTDWMKTNCPAVVHLDGTARPQLVDKETNASMYRIIEEYQKLTGLPCIINTSFNMHEEPIVCTPGDAIRAFKLGHLDYLAAGNFLVKNPRPIDRELVPSLQR
ncbi:MAG TPA: carbamoyltransferase C-terminal domain-containing protein [Dehalococcoidia bacterium]|nr:carbamoyltransferase C-terminal domain-containing protein [Dehalococcoidia bacterium]